jgi:hypothetical protein
VLVTSIDAAQTVGDTSGAIEGVVTDRTGSVLVGVAVQTTGPALMGARMSLSGETGGYRLPALPPGEYTLVFSFPGFDSITVDNVRVAFGSITSVSVTLDVKALQEQMTVVSGVRLLDQHSTTMAARIDAGTLAGLPGSRSMAALIAATPSVQLTRFDVGGSTTFAMGVYSAYGFAGFNRPTVEGIVVSGLNPFAFSLDYGSFEEVSVGLGAYGPELPSPGVHLQAITKSGGNQYRGSFYAGYENEAWQARNIDEGQIARGAASAVGLAPDEANRLDSYRDLNGDVGGFVRKDRWWWYFSARDQSVGARRVTFPDVPIETRASSASGKVNMRTGEQGNIVLFGQRGVTRQPIRLDAFLRADSAINESTASTTDQLSKGTIWKAEWNAAFAPNLYIDARVGQFVASRAERPNGHAPRFEDLNEPIVRGGNRDWRANHQRDQFNGSLSYFTGGGYGLHHLKAGWEITRSLDTETWRRSYPGDVVHVLRNGAPEEVYLFQTPSQSSAGQWWYAAFLNDSWQVNSRVTLNAGGRFDHMRTFLPEQHHPAGRFNPISESYAPIDNLISWNVIAPRIGSSIDVTGNGRTILKSSYGLYLLPAGTDVAFNLNPNARVRWERYRWSDANGNMLWDPGEQATAPLEQRGGTVLETLDSELKLAYVREITTRVEREVNSRFKVTGGVVWRGVRRQAARHPATWRFDAFTVSTTRVDPGPTGGTLGLSGVGPGVTLHDLPDALLGPSETVVRNVAGSANDYLTAEFTADRRFNRWWSLAASFAHTWNHEHASAYFGQTVRANQLPLTPNDLIHTDSSGRHVFNVWSGKLYASLAGPWQLQITPFLRHQSGQPFGRTIAAPLKVGTIRVLAEPVGTRRQDHVTLFDVGVEKRMSMPGGRIAAFIELFNLLNTNAEQNVNWASGPSFLRPLTIIPPRIARIGMRLDW